MHSAQSLHILCLWHNRYAGPPVSFYGYSDTYHLWALVGSVNLFAHTANITWLQVSAPNTTTSRYLQNIHAKPSHN